MAGDTCDPPVVHRFQPVVGHSASPTNDHGKDLWGDPTCGPVGRLDHGLLQLALRRAKIRKEKKNHELPLTASEISRIWDQPPSRLQEPSVDLYAVFVYSTITDQLRDLIEDEPSQHLQSQMRDAILSVIQETVADETSSFHGRCHIREELAHLRAKLIDFAESRRKPGMHPDQYRELFVENLLRSEFSDLVHSRTLANVPAHLSYALPTEVGDPKEFDRLFLSYEADWSGDKSGEIFETPEMLHAERVPVCVVRIYKKSKKSKKRDRLLGVSCIGTADLLDFQQPFKRIWVTLQTPVIYDIMSTSDERPIEGSFDSIWKVLNFLFTQNVSEELILSAAFGSLQRQGEKHTIDANWTICIRQGAGYSGELLFLCHFVPADVNRSILKHDIRSLDECRKFQLERDRHATDQAGAPILRMDYDPNLPVILSLGHAGMPPPFWQFEQMEFENQLEMEEYAELLSVHSMWKWRAFLLLRVHGAAVVPKGNEQWGEIAKVFECLGRASSLSTSWPTRVNLEYGEKLPRFLVEVWAHDEFFGECLLPRLTEIKMIHQTKKLHRLSPSTPHVGLSRPDPKKHKNSTPIKGWISMHATWRNLSPKAGRLNLRVREVRDINSLKTGERVSPQVIVWRYDTVTKTWSLSMKFSPFEYAMVFLTKGQAARSMVDHWEWDDDVMGQREPDWKNYYSWDEPGKLTTEEREVPIQIGATGEIRHVVDFRHLESRVVGDLGRRIWRLCKNGIPPLMRPLMWVELSGAQSLRKLADSIFEGLIEEGHRFSCRNAYSYLVYRSNILQNELIFGQIDEDVSCLRDEYGFDDGYLNDIKNVIKAICLFSGSQIAEGLPLRNGQEAAAEVDKSFFLADKRAANLGRPIYCGKALARICYFLMLNHNGTRNSNEEIFYLLYCLAGANSKKLGIPAAPFIKYYQLYPHKFSSEDKSFRVHSFADGIPYPIQDALFVRSSLELLNPAASQILRLAGCHIEELLFGPLNNLFAGSLPTQSLYRLWDMLFDHIHAPSAIIESSWTFQKIYLASQRQQIDEKNALLCGTAWELQDTPQSNSTRKPAHCVFFEDSFGRRILCCFAYSLLVSVCQQLPRNATSTEVHAGLKSQMAALRDPSDVVRLVERGDFVLFTSDLHTRNIQSLFTTYMSVKSRQLSDLSKETDVLMNILQPFHRRLGHHIGEHVALVTLPTDVHAERYDAQRLSPGLSTRDLFDWVYPAMKYHTVFAPRHCRDLPDGVVARFLLKIDEIEFCGTFPEGKRLRIGVTVGRETRMKKISTSINKNRFVFDSGNVFLFNIPNPPPLIVKVTVFDEDGETKLLTMKKGWVIRAYQTGGSTFKFLGDENLESPEDKTPCHLWFSFFMYVPTKLELPSDKHKHLDVGEGHWGDLCSSRQMSVLPDVEVLIRKMKAEVDPFEDHMHRKDQHWYKERPFRKFPRIQFGLTRPILVEIIFHSLPSLLPYVDQIIEAFGTHDGRVSLREILANLIICSSGQMSQKSQMLFDLFGHHDSLKSTTDNLLYHAGTPHGLTDPIRAAGCDQNKFLPVGAHEDILSDPALLNNSISLAECAALTQTILLRNAIHVDNYQSIQIACAVFEPTHLVPRLIAASLSTVEPLDAAVVRTLQGLPPSGFSTNDLEPAQDVTVEILKFMSQCCDETGFYGFNFSGCSCLKDLGILDILPGISKRLRIVVSASGRIDELDVITIEITPIGGLLSGSGGNYRIVGQLPFASYTQKIGIFGTDRLDVLSPDDRLFEACYIFDLHTITIDKPLFIHRLLTSDLLTEPLRRISSIDRSLHVVPKMTFDCTVDFRVDTSTYMALRPLSYKNEQPVSRPMKPSRRRPSVPSTGSYHKVPTSHKEKTKPTTTKNLPQFKSAESRRSMSSSHSSTRAVERDLTVPAAVVKVSHTIDHEAPPPEMNKIKRIHVHIRQGRIDLQGRASIDAYIKILYGKESRRTKLMIDANGKIPWFEKVDFQLQEKHHVRLEIWHSRVDREEDDLIGFTSVSPSELMRFGPRWGGDVEILKRDTTCIGSLNVVVKFVKNRPKNPLGVHEDEDAYRLPDAIIVCATKASNLKMPAEASHMTVRCNVKYGQANGETFEVNTLDGRASWHSNFKFGYQPEIENLTLSVVDYGTPEPHEVGKCSFKVQKLYKQYLKSKDPVSEKVTILDEDGEPSGKLDAEIHFSSTLTSWPDTLRVTVHRTSQLNPRNASSMVAGNVWDPPGGLPEYHIVMKLGDKEVATQSLQGPNPSWNRTHDFMYKGETEIEFFLYERKNGVDEPLGQCRMDIWRSLKGSKTCSGECPMTASLESTRELLGRLAVSFEFVEPPAREHWPHVVKVQLVEGSNFLTEETATIQSELNSKSVMSKKFVGTKKTTKLLETMYLPYDGSQQLGLSLFGHGDRLGRGYLDLWKMLDEEKKDTEEVITFLNDEDNQVGHIKVKLNLVHQPTDISNFIKISLVKGVGFDVPELALRLQMPDRYKSKNSAIVRTAADGTAVWDESYIFSYEGEASFTVAVLNHAGHVIGEKDVDLWPLIQAGRHHLTMVKLVQGGKRAGRVMLRIEWFSKPPTAKLRGIRVGLRSGAELPEVTGNPYVVCCMAQGRDPRKSRVIVGGGSTPEFNDENLLVVWNPAAEYIRFFVHDDLHDELMAEGKLHVWDIFRDPTKSWFGEVALRDVRGKQAGVLRVAMSMMGSIRVRIPFDESPIAQIHKQVVTAECSVKLMRQKINAAAGTLGQADVMDSDLFKLCRIDDTYDVVFVKDHKEISLNGEKKLKDYRRIGLVPGVGLNLLIREGSNSKKQNPAKKISLKHFGDVCRHPLGWTTFGDPKTISKKISTTSICLSLLDSQRKPSPPEFLDKVLNINFEFHPGSYAPLVNLVWVRIPTRSLHTAAVVTGLDRLKVRSSQWVPAVLTHVGGAVEVAPLSFLETRVGFDDPLRSVPFTVDARDVVACFISLNSAVSPYNCPRSARSIRHRAAEGLWRCPKSALAPSPRARRRSSNDQKTVTRRRLNRHQVAAGSRSSSEIWDKRRVRKPKRRSGDGPSTSSDYDTKLRAAIPTSSTSYEEVKVKKPKRHRTVKRVKSHDSRRSESSEDFPHVPAYRSPTLVTLGTIHSSDQLRRRSLGSNDSSAAPRIYKQKRHSKRSTRYASSSEHRRRHDKHRPSRSDSNHKSRPRPKRKSTNSKPRSKPDSKPQTNNNNNNKVVDVTDSSESVSQSQPLSVSQSPSQSKVSDIPTSSISSPSRRSTFLSGFSRLSSKASSKFSKTFSKESSVA